MAHRIFRSRRILFVFLIVVLVLGAWAYDYFAVGKKPLEYAVSQLPEVENRQEEPKEEKPSIRAYRVETVVSGLEVPWNIIWTNENRMLVTERPGRLRAVVDGKLQKETLLTFPDVSTLSEEGLMGLALDPDYRGNRFLYVCYARSGGSELIDRVVRLIDEGPAVSIDRVVLDNIPAAKYHAGCALGFGPDGKLYISTGDATEKNLAQDHNALAGKILRINADGSIPSDNPFPGSPIWTMGHRNPQGFAWHPATQELYATEHGPSGFDGPFGGDEVNRILRGRNYGWPLVSHERTREGTVAPLLLFTPAEAPATAAFYNSNVLPQFTNNFFFGALKGEGLIRVVFDTENPDKVAYYGKLPEVRFGRIRVVAQGPDGLLYFGTSNRDGRGDPAPNDDRIFRLVPVE